MTTAKYKGHKLRVDGNLPEVYLEIHDHDLSEDVEHNFVASSRIYVAARENHRRYEAERAVKDPNYAEDPDVKGKSIQDFRDEYDLGFATTGILNSLLVGEGEPTEPEPQADQNPPL